MAYVTNAERIYAAMSIKEMCGAPVMPTNQYSTFGGVVSDIVRLVDNPELCHFKGCDVPITKRSFTKMCKPHRHLAGCRCPRCRVTTAHTHGL